MRLLLGSASPRRRELLAGLGIHFEAAAPHIEESARPGEPPGAYVERMAREKAAACARPGFVTLAADTIVLLGGEMLGKPRDRADAERILRLLSGAEHRVITAVYVQGRGRSGETLVRVKKAFPAQLRGVGGSRGGAEKAGAAPRAGRGGAVRERP